MSDTHDAPLPTREKVLIVGAGPAGLAAAAALKALKVPFDLVDRAADVGGIWNPGRKDSPVWPALEMISSTAFTQYEDLLQPASFPPYLNPSQMSAYLRAYAAKYQLTDHFLPRVEVRSARPYEEGVWQVSLSDGRVQVYRALISAHGTSERVHRPAWAPEGGDPQVITAKDWSGNAGLEGADVLVVGSGQSAADIAVDAARRAQEVRWSARTGHWIVPRSVGPVPGDVAAAREPSVLGRVNEKIADTVISRLAGDPSTLGLPAPRRSVLEDRVIVSDDVIPRIREGRITPVPDVVARTADGEVTLQDGSLWKPDLIVLATGYESGVDYLPSDVVPTTTHGAPDLFLSAFPRTRDDLVLLGQVRVSGGLLPVLVQQADVAALFLRSVLEDDQRAETFRRVRAGADVTVATEPERSGSALATLRRSRRRTPSPEAVKEPGQLPYADREELLGRLRTVRSIFED